VKVLLDTNVVLDIVLHRGEWIDDADVIWQASADGKLICCMTASSVTDVYYIVRKAAGAAKARQTVRDCLDVLAMLPVDSPDLVAALNSPLGDFEDALQVACAARERLDAIVTRNVSDFAGSPIPIWSPPQLISRLTVDARS
jgi:predicted nucleic acid-binding protein